METIRVARRRAGLTQKELAARVGRDQSQISRIETGRLALTVPLLLRLANALRVAPGALLTRPPDRGD